MLEALLILLAIGSVLATGGAVIRLLAHRVPMLLPEKLGLAWVLGAGILPVLVWTAGPLVGASLLRIILPAATIGLWAWLCWKRQDAKLRAGYGVLDGVLWMFIGAQAIFAAVWASRLMLGWDALLIWETKARLIFGNNGAMPGAYFADATRWWSHPHYPLGFPALEAWLHLCLGRVDQGWVRIVGPLYWLSSVGIVAGATARLGGTRSAGLVGAAAMFFVPYVFAGTWSALSGYADFPLGVVLMAALSWLLCCDDPVAARLCGLLTAIGTWTKLEGRFFWITIAGIAAAILWCRALKHKRWKQAATNFTWMALPAAIVLGAWSIFLQRTGVVNEAHHLAATPANIMDHAWRIPTVARRITSETMDWESWSFLWLGVLLAIVALALRREWRSAGVFAALFAGVQGIFVVVYTLSTWPDYLLHMDLSLSRLFLQLVPTAMLAIALALPRMPHRVEYRQ